MTQKPTKNSTVPASKIALNKQVLDNVSTEHAFQILKRLADEVGILKWRKENRNPENLEEMDGFIKNNFPKWYGSVLKA